MPIGDRSDAYLIMHALARDTLLRPRDVETTQVAFRKDLVKPGRTCGYEIIGDAMETEYITVQTPLAETTNEHVRGFDNIVIINALRTATPFVEGLLKVFPRTKQDITSADRDEETGMDGDGGLPIAIDYAKLLEITGKDITIAADPMLATSLTMCSVLDHILENAGVDPEKPLVLPTASAPDDLFCIDDEFPEIDLLTVAIGDYLDDDGYIAPSLGDVGDHALRTA